jgi:elongation factor P
MHHESFEQIPVGPDIVGDKSDWLKENEEVSLLLFDGKVIALRLPITVTLKITQCDPGVQGDRASGGTKPATLETGVTIQVPLFVSEGDSVKVDTRTGAYIERVST